MEMAMAMETNTTTTLLSQSGASADLGATLP